MQEVKFSINPTLSMFDNGFDDDGIAAITKSTKERLGYFQSWGYVIVKNESSELQESVGIVVEAETGKVYTIRPEFIIFPKNNANSFGNGIKTKGLTKNNYEKE